MSYLARIALDGSIDERLTTPDVRPLRPVWSPDGKWLVFDAYTLREWYEIYWIRPDGSELHAIPSDLRTGVVPRSDGYYYHSSPENDWLVFMTGNSTDFSLIQSDGTGLHTVPAYGTYQYSAQWSPDGEWLIFEASENDLSNIYRIRPDGSDLENLTNNPPGSLGSGLPVVSPLIDFPFNGERLLALSCSILIVGGGLFWGIYVRSKKRRGRFDLSLKRH